MYGLSFDNVSPRDCRSKKKLYQPTVKHSFRNEPINLSSDLTEKNPPKNAAHFYDAITIVRSFACQKTWGGLWRLLLICFRPSKVPIVFEDYTENLEAGEGNRLHIGGDSQEMPQGDDYKSFLKNNINKADFIRRFNEFVQRGYPSTWITHW